MNPFKARSKLGRFAYHKSALLISIFLLLEGITIPLLSQEDAKFELRTAYTHQHYISRYRFWIRNDVGYRHYFEADPYSMILIRPRAIVELTGIVDFHPSVDFRFTIHPESLNTFELRTWQGVSLFWPDIGRFMFDHFYRFEQRFYWTEGVRDGGIGLRSRYRLRMRVPFNNLTITDHTYFMDLRGEFFIPHDDEIEESFADQMRLGLNFGYNQNAKWRYQLTGYFDFGRNTLEDERQVSKFIIELSVRTSF